MMCEIPSQYEWLQKEENVYVKLSTCQRTRNSICRCHFNKQLKSSAIFTFFFVLLIFEAQWMRNENRKL